MTIEEMHVTFRELAQQMGQQTVRAILSEDIDICLNAAIISKARSILKQNVGTIFPDKIARQNAAISPVNALRTLYKSKDIIANITGTGTEVTPHQVEISTDGVMVFTGFSVSYNNTSLYDCRIIEAERLGQTLRDFCNRATKDAPIVTIFNANDKIQLNIYTGKKATTPTLIRYFYINEPVKVYYDEDDVDACVDCDLPTYLHMEVVEDAIKYYLASVGAIGGNNTNPN